MVKRPLALAVFTPVVVYLVGMALLAAFSLHPPLLGWIGLGVVALIALTIGSAAVVLFPRLGVNAVRQHPRAGERYRLLVVAEADIEAAELGAAVGTRLLARNGEVLVLAPAVGSALRFFTTDEQSAERRAQARLARALASLEQRGIAAVGVVGTDDPLQATGDVLAGFAADEILFVAAQPASRRWSERHYEHRARDLFGLPVSTLYGMPEKAAA